MSFYISSSVSSFSKSSSLDVTDCITSCCMVSACSVWILFVFSYSSLCFSIVKGVLTVVDDCGGIFSSSSFDAFSLSSRSYNAVLRCNLPGGRGVCGREGMSPTLSSSATSINSVTSFSPSVSGSNSSLAFLISARSF